MPTKSLFHALTLAGFLLIPLASRAGSRGENPGDFVDHESRQDMNHRQINDYERQRNYRKWERNESERGRTFPAAKAKPAGEPELPARKKRGESPKNAPKPLFKSEPVSLEVK